MLKVVLAGTYPAYTYEKLLESLPAGQCVLTVADTQEKFDSTTDADIIILRIFKAPKKIIDQNKKLKLILRWGSGFDSVDIKAAGERGIMVTNTPGANASAVSELAILLMLAVGRKLLCHTDSLRHGKWSKNTYLDHSFCLNRKMVGIVGGGNIGRLVADKVRAFGAKTQYYDVCRSPQELEELHQMKYVPFKELLKSSDIVTLHIPLTDSTCHLIGAEEIQQMKDGAMIINTARGGLIDDHALAEAVRRGKLAGAGLDGVENEPLQAESELLSNSNIIITPHVGGGTADIGDEIIPILTQDICIFAAGGKPLHVVNGKYLKENETESQTGEE